MPKKPRKTAKLRQSKKLMGAVEYLCDNPVGDYGHEEFLAACAAEKISQRQLYAYMHTLGRRWNGVYWAITRPAWWERLERRINANPIPAWGWVVED